jgi:hypothetical protein
MTKGADKSVVDKMLRTTTRAKPAAELKGGGAVPGAEQPDHYDADTRLPKGCPVVALGQSGMSCFYLDNSQQLIELHAREHGRQHIGKLFGKAEWWLWENYPRRSAEGQITGWRPEMIMRDLMGACDHRGIWNPRDRVRGRGAWLGPRGELVFHCGNVVVSGPKPSERKDTLTRAQPGLIDRYVYPADEPVPEPYPGSVPGGSSGPAAKFLDVLRSWNWKRGSMDALLLLGWFGAASVGGALEWRPAIWITGGRGTGKSTLHEQIKGVFGASLVPASDASAAGLWQKIGHKTEPVALDEIEAAEDNRKANAVIALARQASSGGLVLRGGADHSGVEFVARSCFLFSSILVPPLLGQDQSRMAILELGELKLGSTRPTIDRDELLELGAKFKRRILDQWSRWHATLEMYRAALAQVGHSARGADQFGTLLAMADMLLHDDTPMPDTVEELVQSLRTSEIGEAADDELDEAQCLNHLMTYRVDPMRNGKWSLLGEWVGWASATNSIDDFPEGQADYQRPEAANKTLGLYGLKVVEEGGERFLAVANRHAGLAQIYQTTHWATRSGAMGVWVQSLRRLPGARRAPRSLWFSGAVCKALLVPLWAVQTKEPLP